MERALAERGLDAAKLREIQELNRQAALLPSYEANLEQTRKRSSSRRRCSTVCSASAMSWLRLSERRSIAYCLKLRANSTGESVADGSTTVS